MHSLGMLLVGYLFSGSMHELWCARVSSINILKYALVLGIQFVLARACLILQMLKSVCAPLLVCSSQELSRLASLQHTCAADCLACVTTRTKSVPPR